MGILKYIIFSVIPVSLLTGCYRDYTDEVKATPVLCINSLITVGEPIEVSVSHTWAYPDDKYIYDSESHFNNEVTDAVVEVFVNETLMYTDYLPKEGDHIKIVAVSEKYGKAEGEVTVPVAVPIESAEWEATPTSVSQNEICFKLQAKLTVPDLADIENFYQIDYSVSNNLTIVDDDSLYAPHKPTTLTLGELRYQSEPIFSEHIGMVDAMIGMDAYDFTFFTDRRFSGDRYHLNMVFNDVKLNLDNDVTNDDVFDWNVCFTLYSVSQSLYNLANYQWQCDNGIISDLANMGLGDAVRGYSNVSTGAGVIAARSSFRYDINLKNFLISSQSPIPN